MIRRLADVVLVECLVGDRDLVAQHRAQRRSGRASLQPGKRRSRLVVLLEPSEQRRAPGDGMRVTFCAQLRERRVKRAAREAPLAPVASLAPAVRWTDLGNEDGGSCVARQDGSFVRTARAE